LARAEGESEELSPRRLAKPIIPVVENMFRKGAAAHHPVAPETDLELLATAAAWAISGPRRQSPLSALLSIVYGTIDISPAKFARIHRER
jgi:hypothetical protein